jgi:hypothetical protein
MKQLKKTTDKTAILKQKEALVKLEMKEMF